MDWAEIALEDRDRVPQWKSGTNNEVYIYTIDTVHHPELRKREVREALALAIDCPTLMEQIFDNLLTCHTNLSQTGTVGILPRRTVQRTPTGDLRRQRLEAIANRVHNEFYFYPNFQVAQIYGMSENLQWEPHYAPRIRANTMYFSE